MEAQRLPPFLPVPTTRHPARPSTPPLSHGRQLLGVFSLVSPLFVHALPLEESSEDERTSELKLTSFSFPFSNHWLIDRTTLDKARSVDAKYASKRQLACIGIYFTNRESLTRSLPSQHHLEGTTDKLTSPPPSPPFVRSSSLGHCCFRQSSNV